MSKIQDLCINTIRLLSAEAIQKANSGHPGLPMGTAPVAFTLWADHMKHNPKNPNWLNRDRFILSAGHGSMLLYSLLHLFGYGLDIEELKNFRQLGSKTPGHPEYGHTVGIETTTGPLGQGVANGVGMAIAEAHLASKFNRPGFNIVDHYTYALAGDGCMMEGITSEASSLAGTLCLGKLIVFYDSNSITIEGDTSIAFREDVAKRYEAYGWQVIEVEDGNDLEAVNSAILSAKSEKNKPTLIKMSTQIGYGCPKKQGKASAHGEPLGEDNIKESKEYLKWEWTENFHIPEEVENHMDDVISKLSKYEDDWNELIEKYKIDYKELYDEFILWSSNELNVDLLKKSELTEFEEKPAATRNASGIVLNKLTKYIPNLIGGSADLAPSTKTIMNGRGDFSAENYEGANLHFGVRENAMAAIANGIAVHGGLRTYASTFFVFSDYMKPSMRLSALMKLPVIYVLTHDSIGVGEDGPTHQPIEHIAALRSMPNMTVIRPADSKETAFGWISGLVSTKGPTALLLTRQNLPYYKETGENALKGAYVLLDSEKDKPDIILMASGSEVSLIYDGAKLLKEKGIDAKVVSMPSWELFELQSEEYKSKVLPKEVTKRLAVEAASSFGWHKYTGFDGDILGIDSFGESGPQEKLYEKFGLTIENVVKKALELIEK